MAKGKACQKQRKLWSYGGQGKNGPRRLVARKATPMTANRAEVTRSIA